MQIGCKRSQFSSCAESSIPTEAGLTAARILQAYGFKALVLEARDRLGGRANTLRLRSEDVEALVEEGCSLMKSLF